MVDPSRAACAAAQIREDPSMNFAHRTVVPLVLQVGFVVECARIAAHVGPQQPSRAGEWATVVGGVLLAVVLAGAVALRVIGPGLRDTGEHAGRAFWQRQRTVVALVLRAVVVEMVVAGRIHVEAVAWGPR
jgi:hypothetical protein